MNNILISAVLFIGGVLVTCNQTESGIEPPPSMTVGISYVDEEGNDLIDPETVQFFNIYYLQQNEETGELEQVEARAAQYSFFREESTNLIGLRLFPSREFIDGRSRTLIESPRDNIDTLTVQGQRDGRGATAEIIWYNDERVWENAPGAPPRYFIITKPADF